MTQSSPIPSKERLAMSSPKLSFHPASPERWPHLERLFGERGACGGCWCMTWRLPRAEWERGKKTGNRLALKTIVEPDRHPGGFAHPADDTIGRSECAPPRE